jgi:hypothetical protein
MKWIAIFLMSFSTYASDKKSEYITSCETSFQRIILTQHPNKTSEAKEAASRSCADMAKNLTDANKWATVTNPKLDACSDAIFMLFDDADRNFRKNMTLRFCL